MKVYKKEAKIIRAALTDWQETGALTQDQAQALDATIEPLSFDWKKLAKYAFWFSILCIVISIGAVLNDRFLFELLERFFDASYSVKCLTLTLLSAGIYSGGFLRRKKHREKSFSNEAIFFFGVLSTAAAVYLFGKALDTGSGHFSLLILFSTLIYAGLGYALKSNLIWVFALLSLGGWLGAETGYASGWGAYYLGMNFPLRFTFFGAGLTMAGLFVANNPRFAFSNPTTLAMGLLYLFVSLWILSIFGNYDEMTSWASVKQIELFHWSLLFALVAGGAIYHGLRYDNGLTKGFGVTFMLLNLYTRYFEFFWDHTHKAIFFAVMGLSFWLLGRKAEIIWNAQLPMLRKEK